VKQRGDVAESRRRFAAELDGLRRLLDRDLGWAPRRAAWIWPVVGLAAGVSAALWWRTRRPRRELPRPDVI